MPKYRKKPVIIEAVQFTYPPTQEFLEFCGDDLGKVVKARHMDAVAEAEIVTLEDGKELKVIHIATEGDFVIRGVQGELYACKPDIFHETYEQVG